MKQVIILFTTLVLAQGFSLNDSKLREHMEEEFEALTSPMMKELIDLKQLLQEITTHEKQHQISTLAFAERMSNVPVNCLPTQMPFIEAFANTDACFNLSFTLATGTDLAENVSIWMFNTSLTVGQILFDFINCASINPFTAVRCMVNEVILLKNLINDSKPIVTKFKQQIGDVFKTLRAQFDECVGIRSVAFENAKNVISQTELCNRINLLVRPSY